MKKLFFATLSLLGVIVLVTLFSGFQKSTAPNMIPIMNDDYTKEWQVIDSLEAKGLPESAYKKVVELYKRAKRENNPTQQIKTILYQGRYISILKEDGLVKAMQMLEADMEKASFPVKPVLQSYIGVTYSKYMSYNYWKIKDRTNTKQAGEDFRTWSANHFIERSRALILASIQNDNTKRLDAKQFAAILTDEKNTTNLRPTLYDILAHEAIDFFQNERNNLTVPAYEFYIEDEKALGDNNEFLSYNPVTKDTSSADLIILKILQSLTKRHQERKDISALIDITLKRLEFVEKKVTFSNKTVLYKASLEKLAEKYKDNDEIARVYYKIAEYYTNWGERYKKGNSEEQKNALAKAAEICAEMIAKFPNSYGAKQCEILKDRIERKSLSLDVELVNSVDRPILAKIDHRNIDKVYLKVLLFTKELESKLRKTTREEAIAIYNRESTLWSKTIDLPQSGDYRAHGVEFAIDPLASGRYMLVISNQKDFTKTTSVLKFHVSNIGYWTSSEMNEKEIVVYDRNSGNPIVDATVEVFTRANGLKRSEEKLVRTIKTPKDGTVKIKNLSGSNYILRISKGKDKIDLGGWWIGGYGFRGQLGYDFTHFFLDRSIYRPGQIVYFKGLAMHKNEEGIPSILSNEEVSVHFHDANNQRVKTLRLETNEYGTFSGSFTAPSGGLLGEMSIHSSIGNSTAYFHVEEYKRLKFKVDFEPIQKSYRLNETIDVTGNAIAFAGNQVDGAKVSYRVVREESYPYSPWRYGYTSKTMEITSGTTTTDKNGNFTISFEAIPDKGIEASSKPEFIYRVYADVVDITGETRSAATSVRVGTVALDLSVGLPDQIVVGNKDSVRISSKNLNGEFEKVEGEIIIEKLATPNIAFRNRYWEKPDQYLLTKSEFKKAFPSYSYKNEEDKKTWKRLGKATKISFNTANQRVLSLKEIQEVGNYCFTLKTQDKYGMPIKIEKYFSVVDFKKTKNPLPKNQLLYNEMDQVEYEPGETAQFNFLTSVEDLMVLFQVRHKEAVLVRKWIKLDKIKTEELKIEERFRGNIYYNYGFAYNGRAHNYTKMVVVPWSNKKLNIEYLSFRNKLSPGQKEEWQIKISGAQKDQVMAEMVATMYDASLDEFAANHYGFDLYPNNSETLNWNIIAYQKVSQSFYDKAWNESKFLDDRYYPSLNWSKFSLLDASSYINEMIREDRRFHIRRKVRRPAAAGRRAQFADDVPSPPIIEEAEMATMEPETYDGALANTMEEKKDKKKDNGGDEVQVRTNLKETVFFYPHLTTDKEGNIIIRFTMNEALTKWKFMGFAHTKELAYGLTKKTIVTQKELMVMPNAPRFMREGDVLNFTAKVSNLTEQPMTGNIMLELYDAITMKPVDILFSNVHKEQNFTAEAGESTVASWSLKIPKGETTALTYRVIAKAGNYSDGEESTLPILSNRTLVTETQPLSIRGEETKTFSFKAMKKSAQSKTLAHHDYTLEFTSNPAWYAVQSLPYLMEYPHECTEQLFSRFYANSLATSIVNKHPKIKRVFEQWKGTDALKSNLTKNQALKNALISETPWVLNALSEEEQKKNIGLLFDLNKMADEQDQVIKKILNRQSVTGGFPWFPGGRDSWYITQYLMAGIGHLDKLGVKAVNEDSRLKKITEKGVSFIDSKLLESYTTLKERVEDTGGSMDDNHLTNIAIHYLYARSFFPQYPMNERVKEAQNYYLKQVQKYWLHRSVYDQGMIGLALYRQGVDVKHIIASLTERAMKNEELGMYWKMNSGYYWYQLPIETQTLMIELYAEVAQDEKIVNELKVWLLKNKQTTHWKTTKATTAAVYALLGYGDNWLLEDQIVDIEIGGKAIDKSEIQPEVGTGYFKINWDKKEIKPAMSEIKVKNPNKNIAWGAVYWQYFEDLDKIKTFEDTPLKLKKSLHKLVYTDRGEQLQKIDDQTKLERGDQIIVRIELRVDRGMEYVHMKDMRASGLEPMNVISRYKYQGGLGYYESTRDVATDFFFAWLPKGTYVFEYPVRVFHSGIFSNGITTIQSMYAPEFTSHSEGQILNIQN